MLYPPKAGSTNSWFISDGFEDSPRIRLDENVSGDNLNGFRLDDNSKVRMSISADTNDVDIGCSGDFDDRINRGYTHKSNDWHNIEMTGFFKATFWGPTDNHIILKGPTGEHHSDTTCCTGSSYNSYITQDNPVKTEFAKEMWHVNYSRRGLTNIPGENYSVLGHGWFGMKFVHFEEGDNVKLEIWYNADGLGQTWKLVNSTVDSGGWGDEGTVCNGDEDQILRFGNARMMYRWDFRDGSDIMFKNLSIREIDPFGEFESTGPDITTFISNLKLQRHINYNEIGCGSGGAVTFYDNLTLTPVGSWGITRFFSETTSIGTRFVNSSAPAVGHILHTLEVPVKKFGSPLSSPVLQARIYNSARTLIYTSPTTFAPDTLTTSYVTKTFDFSTNTRIFAAGDTVELYIDTNDSNDYVQVGYNNPSIANTNLFTYGGLGPYNDTTKEFNCRMIE